MLCCTCLFHLSLRHSPTVVDDACGLEAGGLVELDKQLTHHVGEVLYYFLAEELLLGKVLPRSLHPHRGAVAARVSVHASHHCRNGRLLAITCWGVSDIGTQEDHRLLEYRWSGGENQTKDSLYTKKTFRLYSQCHSATDAHL